MNTIKKSHFIIGGAIFTIALIYAMFSNIIATTGEVPWFLLGIYLFGLTQALLFYAFGKNIFAKGTISSEASAIQFRVKCNNCLSRLGLFCFWLNADF